MSLVTSPTAAADTAVVPSHPWRIPALWTVSTLLITCAAFFTRFAKEVPATSVGFWRVAGASLVLLPWWLIRRRKLDQAHNFTHATWLTGTMLGLHFAAWSWALQNTTIANAMLFIALQPLMVPFLAKPMLSEHLNKREILGCVLACFGMFGYVAGQAAFDRNQIPGSTMAFVAAIFSAAYIVLTRKYRAKQDALLFTWPVFVVAALVQALAAFLIDGGIHVGSLTKTQLSLLGIVLLPTVGGHFLAIYLLRHVKSQIIALGIPTQFVLATIGSMFIFHEIPTASFWAWASFVIVGVILGLTG